MFKKLKTEEGIRILSDNYVGHLAFIFQECPYIIPTTYYYDESSNAIISYSTEGHKINALRKNPVVSFAVDEIESVSKWRSVMVHGTFEELHGRDAKNYLHQFAEGVKSNISRKEDKHLQFISEFSSKINAIGIPIIYRIKISEMTAKFRES